MVFPMFALVFAEALFRLNFFAPDAVFVPDGNYDSYKLRCLEFVIIGAVAGLF